MKYHVEPVNTEQDKETFIKVINRYRKSNGRDKVNWFYKNGEMFLLKTELGEVVGIKGYGFRDFQYNGKTLTGAVSADIVVDENHRTLKPALVLNKESMNMLKRHVDFHFTVPNKKSDVLFKKRGSGFKKVGQFNRYVKILDTKLALKSKIQNNIIVNTLGTILNPFWKVLLYTKRNNNIYVHETNYPNANIKNDISPYFMGVNTPSYLNWRFKQNPQQLYKIVTIKKDNDCGTVIYHEKENRAHVSCILYPTSQLSSLYWILDGFEKHCVKNKNTAIVISCIADEQHKKLFSQLWYQRYTPAGNLWISDHLNIDSDKCLIFTGDIDVG